MLETETFSRLTLEFSRVRCHLPEQAFYGLVPDGERRQSHFFYSTVTEKITLMPSIFPKKTLLSQ